MPTEKQKMLAGDLYFAEDAELIADRNRAEALLRKFNYDPQATPESSKELLRQLLGSIAESSSVRGTFFCDYGYNIHIGETVFINFDCVFLDVMPIYIGDKTQLGPGVHIYAADHPREPEARRSGLECGKPVVIGKNVWVGGAARILPGVTIGDDAIIGTGSIVTRDVPAGTTVIGSPARPLPPKTRR